MQFVAKFSYVLDQDVSRLNIIWQAVGKGDVRHFVRHV